MKRITAFQLVGEILAKTCTCHVYSLRRNIIFELA